MVLLIVELKHIRNTYVKNRPSKLKFRLLNVKQHIALLNQTFTNPWHRQRRLQEVTWRVTLLILISKAEQSFVLSLFWYWSHERKRHANVCTKANGWAGERFKDWLFRTTNFNEDFLRNKVGHFMSVKGTRWESFSETRVIKKIFIYIWSFETALLLRGLKLCNRIRSTLLKSIVQYVQN